MIGLKIREGCEMGLRNTAYKLILEGRYEASKDHSEIKFSFTMS